MSWRHGHVAHRASSDFEAVRVFADHLDADPKTLDSIRVEVVTSVGPADDSEQVREFREHIKDLRDTLWERYLAPIGESLAKQTPPWKPTGAAWDQRPDAADRMTATLTLWSRNNGTGMSS
jgi:alkanesulfonate monooxygenase SsuD/methylene tetrahydromethanopterin reductase-like flavin-dependent oxidoreductase (luciferase family)